MRRTLTLPLLLAILGVAACGDSPTEVVPGRNYRVGEIVTLNVNSSKACETPQIRNARVVAVTNRAVVLADEQNPAGGFSDAEYEGFGRQFDSFVWPTITGAFGEPADVDKNRQVLIFFTSAVNALTTEGSGEYVGGFFFARDLFPANAEQQKETPNLSLCAGSNFAELFYMRVPDPSRPANVWSREAVTRTTVGVLGHEFQHIINASRRLFVVKTTGNNYDEAVWLNEGLSHIAEELLFYAATGLSPRQNLTPQALLANSTAQGAFFLFQYDNFARLSRYLQEPERNSPYSDDDDLATRGATWQFLRYAVDRQGGTESALLKKLVDADLVGFANLRNALGSDLPEYFRDWSVSVYTDDAVATSPRHQQPSWHFRALYPAIPGFNSRFPLRTHQLANERPETLTLDAGGSSYLRFGVTAAGAEIRSSVAGTNPSSTCQQTLALQVGQVSPGFSLANGSLLCVQGVGEYTLIAFYGSQVSAATLAGVTITGRGVAPVLGPPNPSQSAFDVGSLRLAQPSSGVPDPDFERRLRRTERELARLVPGAEIRPSRAAAAVATDPSLLTLSVVRTK